MGGFGFCLRLIVCREKISVSGEVKMNALTIKILLTAILFSIGSAQVSAQTCTSAPIGLISSYSGEGNTLDARSRYNGTIQNGVTFSAGKVGNAFNLAGNNGDRVLLGNTPDLRRQNFTIEAWVKRSSSSIVTNSPNPGNPAGVFFAFGQNGYAFLIEQATGKLGLSQVGQSQVLTPNFTITDTNWHHVAVTVSGPPFTGGTQTIFYIDGVADTPTTYSPQYSFSTNAAIGSRGDGQTDNVFFGLIDELSIYDRPISAAQIQGIFAADTAGKCKPLATNAPNDQVLWLAGDGDANDSTGISNGTLQNGAGFAVGKVGQGFTFDGADDQITIPDNANQNGGTDLTIEAWINPSSLPHGGTILQKRTNGNIGGYVLEPTQTSGGGAPNGLQFVVMIGGVYSTLNPANVLNPNVWQHVSATYDGAFMRIYVNGAEVTNKPQTGAIDNVAAPVVIGRNAFNSNAFQGKIDEVSVYNRALSAAEIESISNAGIAGKYKTQATVPSGIAAWYPADGNTNDLQAANNGALQGGAFYAIGKVGQAFSLNGTNAYVSAPRTAANDPTGAANGATMEAWIYLNQLPSAAGRQFYIMSKNGTGVSDDFDIHIDPDNFFKVTWGGSYSGFGNYQLQTNVWYHVAAVYTPTDQVMRFYLNGVFTNTQSAGSPRTPSGEPLTIGRDTPTVSNTLFNGLIDEPAIYNRALSEAEVRDQYHAGNLGKYKVSANPTVSNTTKTGEATVTFGSLTNSGAVNLTPIEANLFPALPLGMNTGLNFDISTSAVYTNPTVCLNVPSFTPAQFTNLRIYHLESGVWQNRTSISNTYPNLCSSGLTSLSPFAVASVPNTAANSAISGRIIAGKNGLSNVNVTLSGGSLQQPISIKTNSFGNYKFDNLPTGETYIVTVSAKKYTFTPPTKTVNLNDEITDADFVAENQ